MKKYICDLCGKVKWSRKQIRKHVKDIHDRKGQPGGHGNWTELSPVTRAYHSEESESL